MSISWPENEKFGKQQFKITIQIWKILIQFSYHYKGTVTDIMSCEYKIANDSKFGSKSKVDVKVSDKHWEVEIKLEV